MPELMLTTAPATLPPVGADICVKCPHGLGIPCPVSYKNRSFYKDRYHTTGVWTAGTGVGLTVDPRHLSSRCLPR